MDFGQILDSKSYDQVCKYASMPVCQYARKPVYTCLYKKLNKKKDRARPYPRLRDFSYHNMASVYHQVLLKTKLWAFFLCLKLSFIFFRCMDGLGNDR